MSASFPLRASRPHPIYFVTAQVRWTTTARVRLYPHDEKEDYILHRTSLHDKA